MKTRSIARGIVGSVAALLGVMAAGCSADVSDPQSGEAEIGSTAEALTSPARIDAASCVIHDSVANKDYMIVAGGYDPAGTQYLATVDAYKFGTGAGWVARASSGDPLFQKTLGTARAFSKGIVDPSNADTCYIVGGEDGSGAVPYVANTTFNVDKISVSNGAFTVAHAATYQLNTARSRFALSRCGTSKLIAVGGKQGGSETDSLEVFDGTNWNTVSTANPTLSAARYDLSLASLDSNFTKFVVMGGSSSGAAYMNTIETIAVGNAACAYNTDVQVKTLKNATAPHADRTLATARTKAAAFMVDQAALGGTHKDQFYLALGDESSALASTVALIEVSDWSNSYGPAPTTGTATNLTARSNPVLVFNGSTPTLVGGIDHAGNNTSAKVQTFSSGAWSSATDLTDPRVEHVAEYVSGTGVFITSGKKVVTGTVSYPTSDETR